LWWSARQGVFIRLTDDGCEQVVIGVRERHHLRPDVFVAQPIGDLVADGLVENRIKGLTHLSSVHFPAQGLEFLEGVDGERSLRLGKEVVRTGRGHELIDAGDEGKSVHWIHGCNQYPTLYLHRIIPYQIQN